MSQTKIVIGFSLLPENEMVKNIGGMRIAQTIADSAIANAGGKALTEVKATGNFGYSIVFEVPSMIKAFSRADEKAFSEALVPKVVQKNYGVKGVLWEFF